jgi:hypothetical protein
MQEFPQKTADRIAGMRAISGHLSKLLRMLVAGWGLMSCMAEAQDALPWPERIQVQIARISGIGWRLEDAADRVCTNRLAPIGAEFDYIGAYTARDRPFIRQVLRLGDAPQIASVVPGSAADKAGLRPADEIVAIDRRGWRDLAAGATDPDLLADDIQALTAALPAQRQLILTVKREGRDVDVPVARRSRCGARFLLKTGEGLRAYSDTANVAISEALVEFARNDDELALVLGHELAHVLYQDKRDMGVPARRAAEARADLTGAAIARCAGFDIARGVGILTRLGKRDWMPLFNAPTHGSMKSRVERIRAAVLSAPPTSCPLVSLEIAPDGTRP